MVSNNHLEHDSTGLREGDEKTRIPTRTIRSQFFRHTGDGRKTILIVYVNDIILTGDNLEEIERLKKILTTNFEVRDLGYMRYFLGMEVSRSKRGISISQSMYVLYLLTPNLTLSLQLV